MAILLGLLILFWKPPEAAAAPPQRIVSLDLCTDWQLARHADTFGKARVAALSPAFRRFFPPDLRPKHFPIHAQEAESVLAFAPDLVLVGTGNARLLSAHLQRLGMRVEILPLPRTLAEVAASERHFFALLGLAPPPRPEVTTPDPASNAPRLLLFGANGIGTGRNTLEDEMLRRAGWRNYLAVSGYVRVDLEQLALDPPDALVWSAPAGAALANAPLAHPLLRRILPAARIWQTDTWPWQCPGAATWDLIAALRHWRSKPLPEKNDTP
ncbi:MAG: hypothetical protein LBR88_06630 [Zoogloeaceae bacterium]|nr:hypothetical protein [Zoogloeaceae bacterium]